MRIIEFFNKYILDSSEEPVSGTVVAESAAAAYFKACALATAVSYKANAITMSEFRVYERGDEVHDTMWHRLNYSPNPNQNASEFWGHFMRKLVLDGEALIIPLRNSLYVADSFNRDQHDLGQHVYDGITVGNETVRSSYRASRAFYFHLDDENIAAMVNNALDSYAEMMAKAMQVYKQSCGTKYKVVMERRATGDGKSVERQRQMLSDNLKAFLDNANAVYMETAGQRLEPVKSDSSVEPADITALRKDIYDSAAISMKIPRSIMYGDMTNIGDIVNVMLTFAVDPCAKMIARELTRKNYSEEEVAAGSRITVDTSTVKHTDLFDVAPDAMNLISSGVMTIDDLLVALGREPEDTPFTTQRWMTRNIAPIEDVLAGEDETSEGGEQNA